MEASNSGSRFRSSKGFTLIEMMTVMVIVGLLASIAVPKYQGYIEQARIARCIAEIRYLERDIQAFYVANERYPYSLADLHLTIQAMLDPWGRPYQYFLIAGTKWVKNGGGNGPYYASGDGSGGTFDAGAVWRLAFLGAAADSGSDGGFWSGSWFAGEAWAAPIPQPTAAPLFKSRGWSRNSLIGVGPAKVVPVVQPPPPPPPPPGPIPPSSGQSKPRKDRFLKPLSSDYDLYSMGVDGLTKEQLNSKESYDDIIRASNGAYVGLAGWF